MRHLEVLTEELSMSRTLEELFSQYLPKTTTYRIIEFNGVESFFSKVPDRMRGYYDWIPPEYRIVLLVDRDREDYRLLKKRMDKVAEDAGLGTKTNPKEDGSYSAISRIVIEELESWFFGDVLALHSAYPRVPATLSMRKKFRDPDTIRGGTAEALLRVLQEAGYYNGLARLPKLEVAQRISENMEPSRNRSHSFRIFWDTIVAL